jgi:predicted ATPase
MRIESIRLTGFKRFTDLVLQGLERSHQLVVLVGPNGSGKSSLFEAFNTCIASMEEANWFDRSFHMKVKEGEDNSVIDIKRKDLEHNRYQEALDTIRIRFFDQPEPNWKKGRGWEQRAFYLRGSTRTSAEHSSDRIQPLQDVQAERRSPQVLLSVDSKINQNYQRLVHRSLQAMTNPGQLSDLEVAQNANSLLRQLQKSVARVFPGLELDGLGDATNQGTFIFHKVRSGRWRFKNLSSGEKSAFDLLLDFLVKREKLEQTVYCIDEPELHMHTELQARLLEEILSLMPAGWQVWIATHSIGMMRAAKGWGEKHPRSVAFIDFSDRDFDSPVTILPEDPTRQFWKRTFSVALGDLVDLVAPSRVVFCEGSLSRNGQFDAKILRQIFGGTFPDTEFISLGSASEVERNGLLISAVLKELVASVVTIKVIDRDDRGEIELGEARNRGVRVLSRRHLESYLFDDEILTRLCDAAKMPDSKGEVLDIKRACMKEIAIQGKPEDDVKSAAGQLYVGIRRLLNLRQCGNNTEAFCIQMLAPLITSDSIVYGELLKDIFAK